jgi:hypothetical protein
MDERYFCLLNKYGYIADCSVTPGVSWEKNWGRTPGFHGSDYSKNSISPQQISGIYEVPVSIIKPRKRGGTDSVASEPKWLRPNTDNLNDMMNLVRQRKKTNIDNLEFMIHSSELMPGGSPTFTSEESIEKLYQDMEKLFKNIARSYKGIGLEEYVNRWNE